MQNKENRKIFQSAATISKVETLVDRTYKLVCYLSNELPPEQAAMLFSFSQSEGWLCFAENPLQMSDIPEGVAKADKNTKSPSQRLRATAFVYWKQRINNGDFESWYRNWIESKINDIKKELN